MASFDQTIRIENPLLRCMLSEFFGTFLLIFIAHSTGSAYSLASIGSADKVAKIGAVTFGVGCAALIALTTTMPVSGGHINPAITVAVATIGHFPWSRVIPYIFAQHLGGFVAAAAIYLTFNDNIQTTQAAFNGTEGLHRTAHMFTSLPPPSSSLFASFLGSFWGTAVFLFGIAAILEQKSSMKPPKWYWPLGVSFVLMISLAAFGANGGPNVNPAADFPTRIFASCVGWAPILWNGSWWLVIGLVAPHTGAIFALWVYRICISAHYPDEEGNDAQDTHELRQLQEKQP